MKFDIWPRDHILDVKGLIRKGMDRFVFEELLDCELVNEVVATGELNGVRHQLICELILKFLWVVIKDDVLVFWVQIHLFEFFDELHERDNLVIRQDIVCMRQLCRPGEDVWLKASVVLDDLLFEFGIVLELVVDQDRILHDDLGIEAQLLHLAHLVLLRGIG